MKQLHSVHPEDFKSYTTQTLRDRFLLPDLMQSDSLSLNYTSYDRMIVGGAMPRQSSIDLQNQAELRAEYFLERRELGIINVGGAGEVEVDGKRYQLGKLDCLYVSRGSKQVSLHNAGGDPVFYLLSAPAHADYPTTLITKNDAESNSLGSLETSNQRTIYRYIHKNGGQSCQLVMGLTLLETGSVWNTIPPHTHSRRMEVYFYFDVPENQVVFHYMGEPSETRHLVMKNYQAAVSPTWSIHAGSGTSNYGFIWGMAGENLDYSDMDAVSLNDLR